MAARRIVAVVYPNVQVLDVTGPLEVFAMADRLAGEGTGASYRNEVVSAAGGLTPTTSGIALDTVAMRKCRGAIDTLVVAGGMGTAEALADRALADWITSAAGRSRRIPSVCSGASLLAEAGLLDERQATTHWSACDLLARRYPAI